MRRPFAAAAAAFAVVASAAGGVAVSAGPAAAEDNGLALTPPMGFNDWNAFGCNTSEALIEQTADAMVANGMKAAGYDYVNIDDCWQEKTRDANGDLVADPAKFPDGIAALAAYVHSKGLKLGIYEDAGTTTCGGYPGSLGHEQQDAALFASWGADYLKYDQCNIPFTNWPNETHEQIDEQLYTTMSNALKATGRPMVFSMCNGTDAAALPWLWGAPVSNLWRTTTDIQDNFASMVANVNLNATLAQYAGPGAWNDPDMLEIGNGGMSTTEYESEFSLWAEMAAPLIAGTDLRTVSAADLAIYTDRNVIAVDQDSLGKQGVLLTSANGLYVFAKPLSNGDVSVALFNSTGSAATISTTAAAAGLPKAIAYTEKDLWANTTTETAGKISAFVPAHGTVMYRVTAAKTAGQALQAAAQAPNTTLAVSAPSAQIGTGGSTTVTVTVTDNGVSPVLGSALRLQAPSGWTVREQGPPLPYVLLTNQSAKAAFTVSAPSSAAPISSAALTASASYLAVGGTKTAQSTLDLALVSPVQSPYSTANTTGAAAVFGQSGSSFAIQSAGTGISPQTTTSRGTRAASDSYAAIYRPGGAGTSATAEVTVTANATSGTAGESGLIMRDDMTAAGGSPEGVALFVSARGAITLDYNATGGAVVDTSVTVPSVTVTYPVALELTRSGASYSGYYSTGGGTTWLPVGTVTVASSAAAGPQDAGVFHASGSATGPSEGDFGGFALS
ncbi:MAG TPA: glycoside hydrolase family 27 protein [Actinocrinis sp.]|jgi:alpha-galactosidase